MVAGHGFTRLQLSAQKLPHTPWSPRTRILSSIAQAALLPCRLLRLPHSGLGFSAGCGIHQPLVAMPSRSILAARKRLTEWLRCRYAGGKGCRSYAPEPRGRLVVKKPCGVMRKTSLQRRVRFALPMAPWHWGRRTAGACNPFRYKRQIRRAAMVHKAATHLATEGFRWRMGQTRVLLGKVVAQTA